MPAAKPSFPVLQRGHPHAQGLVGDWLFYEGSGLTSNDVSGRNNGGTLTGTPTWTGGQNGWALSLNGSSDYVLLGSSVPGGALGTIAAWINPSSTSGYRTIYATGSRGLWLHAGKLDYYTGTDHDGTIAVSTDVWTHITCVINNIVGSISYYVNGVLDSSFTGLSNFTGLPTGSDLGIGGHGGEYFAGLIDGMVIYDRALSKDEIAALYADPFARHKRKSWRLKAAGDITFDSASNSGYQAASSTYSWSHTCTGSDRFLAVDVSLLSAGSTVTSITYNGVALSFIGGQSTVTSFGRIECWGLANPAGGSNTITVTLSGSVASAGLAVSYTGAHQTSPTEAFNSAQATNGGSPANATVDVTTVADGDWVHGAVATNDTSVTANQTSRNNVTGIGGSGANEDFGPQSPAGVKTMSFGGVGMLLTWTIGAYGIRPAGAAAYNPQGWEQTESPALLWRRRENRNVIPY